MPIPRPKCKVESCRFEATAKEGYCRIHQQLEDIKRDFAKLPPSQRQKGIMDF